MEDQWLGPYTIAELNADKGICRLVNRSGKTSTPQTSKGVQTTWSVSCRCSEASNNWAKATPFLNFK